MVASVKVGDEWSDNGGEKNRRKKLNAKLPVYIERSSNDIETTDSYCTDLTDCIDRKTAVLFTVENTVERLICPSGYRTNRKKSHPCRPSPLTRQRQPGDAVTIQDFI